MLHNLELNSFNYIENPLENTIPHTAVVFSCNENDLVLVPGLLEAFDFVEFFICYYDSGTNFDYDESVRHRLLIKEAEDRGAEWVYLTQPTMRCAKNSRTILEPLFKNTDGIIYSDIYYFWDYCLNKVRIDSWSGVAGPTFFRIHPNNFYRGGRLHHIATPTNLPRVNSTFKRYDLRRLGKEVCIGKANYYQKLDGTPHNGLRDFNKLQTMEINPKTIKGLGKEELQYIETIRRKYCDNPV